MRNGHLSLSRAISLCLVAAFCLASACSFYKPRYELHVTNVDTDMDMLGYASYSFTIESIWAEGLGYATIEFEAEAADGTIVSDSTTVPMLVQGEKYDVPSSNIDDWTDDAAPVSARPVKVMIAPQVSMLPFTLTFEADEDGWKAVSE